jgi:hypothetical protein
MAQNRIKVQNVLNKVNGRLSDATIKRLTEVGVQVSDGAPNISDLRQMATGLDFSAINKIIEKLETFGVSVNSGATNDDLEAVLEANRNKNQGQAVRQTISQLERLGVEVSGDKEILLDSIENDPITFSGHRLSDAGEASLLRLEQLVAQIKQDQNIVTILQEIANNKLLLADELKRSAAFVDTSMQVRLQNIGFNIPTNKHLKSHNDAMQLSQAALQLVTVIEKLGISVSDNPKVATLLTELEENKRQVEKAVEEMKSPLNGATIQRLEKLGITPSNSNFKRFFLNLGLGKNLENQVKFDVDDLESLEAVKKLNSLRTQ